ncbi:hypothetical protein BCR33DRAFT_724860 [Rhizoclosmatium globosum]|uniref:Uncharacterized protein n=1 Tax=Rhizoclosmatium globosum TaxID=329046 RepID=A0A1Y2B2Y2_9FUNG|nr:hypothetical protein BCR33DRAFT_724860 [Rhizoclosmatium globosum]|eukprot:ORY29094.1 hypothetical protein BCR33DRAFT_724860 [Rhizoclosmatium globosum]
MSSNVQHVLKVIVIAKALLSALPLVPLAVPMDGTARTQLYFVSRSLNGVVMIIVDLFFTWSFLYYCFVRTADTVEF